MTKTELVSKIKEELTKFSINSTALDMIDIIYEIKYIIMESDK